MGRSEVTKTKQYRCVGCGKFIQKSEGEEGNQLCDSCKDSGSSPERWGYNGVWFTAPLDKDTAERLCPRGLPHLTVKVFLAILALGIAIGWGTYSLVWG